MGISGPCLCCGLMTQLLALEEKEILAARQLRPGMDAFSPVLSRNQRPELLLQANSRERRSSLQGGMHPKPLSPPLQHGSLPRHDPGPWRLIRSGVYRALSAEGGGGFGLSNRSLMQLQLQNNQLAPHHGALDSRREKADYQSLAQDRRSRMRG